jgi:MFS family permease
MQRARIAVSVLFFVNALTLSAWLPRLAEIQIDLALSDFDIGLALTAGAVGGVAAGILAGPLIGRMGSNTVAVLSLVAILPVLPMIGLAGGLWVFALVLLVVGALDAVMDAAMNSHAMRVQHGVRRSILNTFHGYWSLGTVAGGLIGVGTAAIGMPLAWSLAMVSVLCALLVFSTRRWLLPGKDPESFLEGADEHGFQELESVNLDPSSFSTPPPRVAASKRLIARPVIWTLGAFIILAVMIEDIPGRWSSIYLTEIGTPERFVGWGYVAFSVAMTAGRFLGDRIVDAIGERTWTRIAMTATALTLGGSLMIGSAWAFIIGCAVTGFGVATLFPAAMRAVAHLPGIKPATGVATLSWLSRAGFVVAPLAVGAIADGVGIAWGVGIAVLAAVALLPLSAVLKSAKSP